MRLEVIDFPSDPNCELTPGLREKLVAALQRADESKSACVALEQCLVFAVKKLQTVKKQYAAAPAPVEPAE